MLKLFKKNSGERKSNTVIVNNLCRAIRNRNLSVVEEILLNGEKKVNVNVLGHDGCAPIHCLSNYNLQDETSKRIFNILINHPNLEICMRTKMCGYTLLHLTTSPDVVRELLKHPKVNVDVRDDDGQTPLYLCITHFLDAPEENLEICKLLIGNGRASILVAESAFYDLFIQFGNHKDEFSGKIVDKRKLELLNQLLNLPFQSKHYLPMFDLQNDDINENIYKQWNEFNYNYIIKSIFLSIEHNCPFRSNSRIVKGIWTYLYRHHLTDERDPMNNIFFMGLFQIVKHQTFVEAFALHQSNPNEFDAFLQIFRNCGQGFSVADVDCSVQLMLDSTMLRKVIENSIVPSSWLPQMSRSNRLFAVCLTYFRCDLNTLLTEIRPPFDLLNIHLISRYCTLPKNVFEYFRDHVHDDIRYNRKVKNDNLESVINNMKLISERGPKSLMEISRNCTRLYLASTVFKAEFMSEIAPFIAQMRLPKSIREIIMLERPLYWQIQAPILRSEKVF